MVLVSYVKEMLNYYNFNKRNNKYLMLNYGGFRRYSENPKLRCYYSCIRT